jgi:hypothetical protein
MQLSNQPFLEIEQESHHRNALAAISFACVLLALIKGNALLQYWQQTHHIFMEAGALPSLEVPGGNTLGRWQALSSHWLDEREQRLLLAGQLLLVGDKALPEPETPLVGAPKCPKPVTPAQPACPTPALTDKGTEVADPQTSVVANIRLAENQYPATDSIAGQTTVTPPQRENATLGDVTYVEPTPEQLAAAAEPIGLQAGDRILLVGDSLMQGVAPHLITALKRNYQVESMDLSRHSTGLTYPAFFDWPATVKAAFELEDYQAVIVFLGANDPWDMNLQGKYVRFGSARWQEVYRARVNRIIQTAAEHGARLVWLGVPPLGREDLIGKEPPLNEIYASEAQKYPLFARFVATAPSLSEDGNSFTKFMELPERGSVMVRTDDGVHFTTQGQKLLAKLALSQFTGAAQLRAGQPGAQPTTEPDATSAEPQPAALHPAQTGEPPPNPQPNPTISLR